MEISRGNIHQLIQPLLMKLTILMLGEHRPCSLENDMASTTGPI